jgi:hypothetical protein
MTGYFTTGVPTANAFEAAVLLLGSAPERHPT